jgi:hypothetical protein
VKPRTQILLSAGLLAFAVIAGILFQWRPGNYLFLVLISLQIIFTVGFSIHVPIQHRDFANSFDSEKCAQGSVFSAVMRNC